MNPLINIIIAISMHDKVNLGQNMQIFIGLTTP